MALGNRILVGLAEGVLFPQESPGFNQTEAGFDEGTLIFLTHPRTNKNRYPRRGSRHLDFPFMYVVEVGQKTLESGLVEITAHYRGLMDANKPEKFTGAADAMIFSVPDALTGNTFVVEIPIPTLTRIYLTTFPPNHAGVGGASTARFLPPPPDFPFTITGLPSVTINLVAGWVLKNRTWNDAGPLWEVTENYAFNYNVSP
jgi:hypothetical protein